MVTATRNFDEYELANASSFCRVPVISVRGDRIMRHATSLTIVILLFWSVSARNVQAAPITGGTGPDGVEAAGAASDLTLWFRADSLSQGDGTPIDSWTSSAFAANVASNTGSPRPTYIDGASSGLNNQPVVRFDGSDDVLAVSGTATYQDGFFVARNNDTGVNGTIIGDYSNGDGGDADRAYAWHAGVLIDTVQFSDSYNAAGSWRIDGVGQAPNGAVTSDGVYNVLSATRSSAKTFDAPAFRVGLNDATYTYLDGDIAEIITFSTARNTVERAVMENYLSSKYDLAITGDLYAGDSGGNGDYDSDVFGIGRDDGSNMVSTAGKQGLGLEDAGGTLGDGEYLFAGHKTATNSLVAEGDLMRWDRVWYLDKTTTDGIDATLHFNFTDAGLILPAGNQQYSLLYSSTNAFSFTTLATVASVSGDTVSFLVPNSLLSDGYYTLAFQAAVPEPSTLLLLSLGALGLIRRVRRRRRLA